MRRIEYRYDYVNYKRMNQLDFIKVVMTRRTINLIFGKESYQIKKRFKSVQDVLQLFEDLTLPLETDREIVYNLDGSTVTIKYDDKEMWFSDPKEQFLIDFEDRLNQILMLDLKAHCNDMFEKLSDDIFCHSLSN